MNARVPRVVAVLSAFALLGGAAIMLGAGVVRPCADRPYDPTCVVVGARGGDGGATDAPAGGVVGPDGELASIEPMPSATPGDGASGAPTPGSSADWSAYTFHDEFDGTELDPHWGRHWGSLGISELSRAQASVADGVLSIAAERTATGWTSDLLDTFASFRQRYGYFEARIRVPQGPGLWPAFWLADDWAASPAEFDVAEICANPPGTNHGNDVTVLHQIIHGEHVYRLGHKALRGEDLSKDWHTYAVDWRADHVSFYFDGVETWRYTDAATIPRMPMTVILSLELGTWCGRPEATTPSPAVMQVDWVRVRP